MSSTVAIALTCIVKADKGLDYVCAFVRSWAKDTMAAAGWPYKLHPLLRQLMDSGLDEELTKKLFIAAAEAYDELIEMAPRAVRIARRTPYTQPAHRTYTGPVTPRLPENEWWPLRWSVLQRDNFKCSYCGDSNDQMCADHVHPLSRGGTNDASNLVAACLPCNSSKSDRLLSEWRGRRG